MIIELTATTMISGTTETITSNWDTDLTIVAQSNSFTIQIDEFSYKYSTEELDVMKKIALSYLENNKDNPNIILIKEGNRPKSLTYTDENGIISTLIHNYIYDIDHDMCFLLMNENIKITK